MYHAITNRLLYLSHRDTNYFNCRQLTQGFLETAGVRKCSKCLNPDVNPLLCHIVDSSMLLDYRDQQNIVNSTLMHFMKDTLRDFIDLVVLCKGRV